jgi:hypothetical protein
MASVPDVDSVLEEARVEPIPYKKGQPYILLDGILRSSHNTLAGILMGRAAHEALGVNVGYLCWQENPDHYCDRLFKKAGVEPVEWRPYVDEQSALFKLWARLRGAWHAILGGKRVLDVEQEETQLGDLIYDSIIRYNPDVLTLDDATPRMVRSAVVKSLTRHRAMDRLFEDRNVQALALSHKTYSRFGVPGRLAVKHGCTVFSRKTTHVNRIESMCEYKTSDFYIGRDEFGEMKDKLKKEGLEGYSEKRLKGKSRDYNNECAFGTKKEYKKEVIEQKMGVGDRPVAVIAPHIFSDEPHVDRGMVYRDYYVWLIRTIELAASIPHVQWVVKPHPSAAYYGEEGVVERIVRRNDSVQLAPSDVKTDSVLQVVDAVCTVRGTIGLEALLFDCQVILAGNAYYEEIDAVNLCLDEDEYERALRSIGKKESLPAQTKEAALAALYYSKARFDHASPLLGIERPPCLSEQEELEHDLPLIETATAFLKEQD